MKTIDLLSRKRRMPLGHPWNRGYPNNKRLREAVGEAPESSAESRESSASSTTLALNHRPSSLDQ